MGSRCLRSRRPGTLDVCLPGPTLQTLLPRKYLPDLSSLSSAWPSPGSLPSFPELSLRLSACRFLWLSLTFSRFESIYLEIFIDPLSSGATLNRVLVARRHSLSPERGGIRNEPHLLCTKPIWTLVSGVGAGLWAVFSKLPALRIQVLKGFPPRSRRSACVYT